MGVSIYGLMGDGGRGVVKEIFAVVYTPKKKKRVPAACVQKMDSEKAALEASDPARKRHAGHVFGSG